MQAIVQDPVRHHARDRSPTRHDRPPHDPRRRSARASRRRQRRQGHVARDDRPAVRDACSPASDSGRPRRPTPVDASLERSSRSARMSPTFKPGDEVYGTCAGSFAEYASAKPSMLATKPANLSFEQAASVPISGSTALQAIRKANVQPGQHVLIIGASGGVGTFAVQIAKASGAEVTGVCSTDKIDLVRSLGADHVIDYTRRGSHRWRASLRRHHRHRRQPPTVPSPARDDPTRDTRHRWRRDRRTLARRIRTLRF